MSMKRNVALRPASGVDGMGRGLRGAHGIAASHDRHLRASWISSCRPSTRASACC